MQNESRSKGFNYCVQQPIPFEIAHIGDDLIQESDSNSIAPIMFLNQRCTIILILQPDNVILVGIFFTCIV